MRNFILFLYRWNKFPKDSLEYQRARLVNAILLVMTAILVLISLLDLFIFHDRRGALIDFAGALLSSSAFIYFRKTRNIQISSRLTVYLFIAINMAAIIIQLPDNHIVIWMCAVPPVAFYLMGVKRGYLISVLFALILEIFIVYKGFLHEGAQDVVNITLAYTGIVIFIAYFEKSREEGFAMLLRDIEKRKKVENQIQLLNNELEQKVILRTRQLQEMNYRLNAEIIVRRRAEEASNNARLAALEANKVKSEFLSRMSHKLRTPLNSILGFSQLLEMTKLDDRQLKNLRHIHHGGKELLSLVDDILEINTIDNLEVNVSAVRLSLNNLIKTSLQILNNKILEKNLHIKLLEDPAGDLFIRSDQKLLGKVIFNLLDNAVKFNKTGGEIKIQVKEIRGKNGATDSFRLSFEDTGIGILAADQPKIFDLFLTGDTGSYDAENIGLGLTVAKKIVEKLGGTIGVESQHGIGSNFRIELPVSLENIVQPQKMNGSSASHPTRKDYLSQNLPVSVTDGTNG